MKPDRSTVFSCLLDVMPTEFGQLEQAPRDLAGLVITDVCKMIESEGWVDVYAATVVYAGRLRPPDNEPGYLTRYAEGLLAQQEKERNPQIIPGTLVYSVFYGVTGEPGQPRYTSVVIGDVMDDRDATTFGDILRILSVALWGTQDTSRIYITGMTLDRERSDTSILD